MIKIRRNGDRGHANHGWLDSYHTFSFADYYNPAFQGYRDLRVINEDRVKGGQGFTTHPHRDFEIVSYIVSGALRHRDSMGHTAVMRSGDVQRISAGTGIAHSEFNDSPDEVVHFLQIWIVPSRTGLEPNYAEASFSNSQLNRLSLVCSETGRDGSIKINQDIDLYVGILRHGQTFMHSIRAQRAVWLQLIDGEIDVNGTLIRTGDAVAIEDERESRMTAIRDAHFLLFDLK